jgi:hypothetical protein
MRFFHAGFYNQRSKHVKLLWLLTKDICVQLQKTVEQNVLAYVGISTKEL